jgi:hypothetical protein
VNPRAESSRLRRFFGLSPRERWLFFEAWWRLLAAALRLRLAPRRTVAQALLASSESVRPTADGGTISSAARAVARAAAHHLTPMTCLPRSLALQRMLARRGIAARVAIGVRKQGGSVAAHAWVEVGGEAVGEPEAIAERFLPFVLAAKE